MQEKLEKVCIYFSEIIGIEELQHLCKSST